MVEEVDKISVVRGDQEAVNKYVEVKKDAIDLVKEFREKAGVLLNSEDIVSLREQFNNIDKMQLNDLKIRIRGKIRMLNAERARRVLEFFEKSDEEMIRRIGAGNMTASQIKERLRQDYNSLSAEEMEKVRSRAREEAVRVRLLRVDRISKARIARVENAAVRYGERARILEGAGFTNAGARLRERAGAFEAERESQEMKRGITARSNG